MLMQMDSKTLMNARCVNETAGDRRPLGWRPLRLFSEFATMIV
jgi:hypothetical protein